MSSQIKWQFAVEEMTDRFLKPTTVLTFDATGGVSVDLAKISIGRYHGCYGWQGRVLTERLELPRAVANGILFTLLKNIQRSSPKTIVSYVAARPKPRLVNLEITPQGQNSFSIGSYSHKAIHYMVKVKIGGAAGLVEHLVGKQPPDTQSWVLGDDAPAFVRSDGPLYGEGYMAHGTRCSCCMADSSAAYVFRNSVVIKANFRHLVLMAYFPGHAGRFRSLPMSQFHSRNMELPRDWRAYARVSADG